MSAHIARAALLPAAVALSLLLLSGCPSPGSGSQTPTPSRIAVLGDSSSMGIQDAGLVQGSQLRQVNVW